MIEKLKLKGKVQIIENGKIVYEKDNLIVTGGKDLLLSRLVSNSDDYIDYIAVGSDDTAVLSGDSTLGTELDRNQVTTTSVTDNVLTIDATFSSLEAIGTWKEAGLFNASSSGTMFDRVIINYTKGNTATTVRFTIEFI